MISGVVIFFYPTAQFLMLIGFMVMMDTITGVMALSKTGEEFTSKKFRAVIPKYTGYGVGILVAHVIQCQFFPEFPAMIMVAGLVAWSELVSIDENIKKITGVSLFKFFIKKLGK